MPRAPLRAKITAHGELSEHRPTKDVRHHERRRYLPRRLIHGPLPQAVAILGCSAESIPTTDLLALVVELKVVDNCLRVQPQQRGDDGSFIVCDEAMPFARRNANKRLDGLSVDEFISVWKTRCPS